MWSGKKILQSEQWKGAQQQKVGTILIRRFHCQPDLGWHLPSVLLPNDHLGFLEYLSPSLST